MANVIRTIRTSNENDEIIREEAKKQGVSMNSLINQIIEKYVTTYRLIESFPCLIIPCEMVKGWLDGMAEDFIFGEGAIAGSFVPKHGLFLNKMTPNLENVLFAMEKRVGQHSNWFQLQRYKANGKLNLLLRHNLGKKWSIFLNAYYTTLFEELLKIKVETEVGEKSLEIIIPEPIKLNNFNNGKNGHNGIEIGRIQINNNK
ncbi:MAG: hypothetical protein P8X62_10890 [Flavobacteriaceae bacterium]|jgi:hypothetical protein